MIKYSIHEKKPYPYAEVWLTLTDRPETAGIYFDNKFHICLYLTDGTPIVTETVTSQVLFWSPIQEVLTYDIEKHSTEKVLKGLLTDFEKQLTKLHKKKPHTKHSRKQFIPQPANPIPFFLPLFDAQFPKQRDISKKIQQLFTPGQLSIIFHPSPEFFFADEIDHKHNNLLNSLWQSFLQSSQVPKPNKKIKLITTYRKTSAAFLYTLQQQSYYRSCEPQYFPAYKQELIHMKNTTKTLHSLPITFYRYHTLSKTTRSAIAEELNNESPPPGLILLETLTTPTKNGDILPPTVINDFYKLAKKHHIPIIILATSLSFECPF